MIHETRAGQQFRQLPMFMTAREIRRDYQALDADRQDPEDWGWANSSSSGSGGSSDNYVSDYYRNKWREDDDELFDRKYEEATVPHFDRPSLADRLLSEGVKNPVSLQVNHEYTGSEDKPEILGGHHRIAVMETHKPDVLMPVEHFEHLQDARRSLGEKY